MVKRLQSQQQNSDFLHTKIVRNRQEAIDEKLKLLHGSFFGRPIVKFEVDSMRDVWVPYGYLVYQFKIEGKGFSRRGGVRDGKVAIVFDLNENHPMQYDIYENGELQFAKKSDLKEDRKILKKNLSEKDMMVKTEEHIQNRIMRRFYGRTAQLSLIKKQVFFRPAVEMDIIYKKENMNKRYVYLDEFGIQSEHILGLKYRVEHKS